MPPLGFAVKGEGDHPTVNYVTISQVALGLVPIRAIIGVVTLVPGRKSGEFCQAGVMQPLSSKTGECAIEALLLPSLSSNKRV